MIQIYMQDFNIIDLKICKIKCMDLNNLFHFKIKNKRFKQHSERIIYQIQLIAKIIQFFQ